MATAVMRGETAAATGPKVAVLTARVVALVIDGLIFSIVRIFLSGVFGVTRVTSGSPFIPRGGGSTSYSSNTGLDLVWGSVLGVAYFLIQEALFGATVGKAAMGLRVVDKSGNRLTMRQTIVRNVARLVDWLPNLYILGALSIASSPSRQRIGDRLAGTLVVDQASTPYGAHLAAELRRNARLLLIGLAVFAVFCLGYAYRGRPPLVIESWRNTGQYFFDKPVAPYTLDAGQWSWEAVSYRFTYRPASGHDFCHGLMTLQWKGPFEGWALRNGSSYCPARGRTTSFYGYGGN